MQELRFQKRVVFIDAYNLMHRARFGFVDGPYNVIFNFFRGLRPLVEKFNPDKIYFVMEGHPQERFDIYPEYKANRKVGLTPKKLEALEDFRRQRDIIYELIKHFPIECIYHPDYECDDLIASLITGRHSDDECIVLSNDTDFIQIYALHPRASVYSPIKKTFLMPTQYDYVAWKALVGDTADNIKGVPRVGKKTADSILSSNLDDWLEDNPEKAQIFKRNVQLIKFSDLSDRLDECVTWQTEEDFSYIKERFDEMEFSSITTDKSWAKFVSTFSKINNK